MNPIDIGILGRRARRAAGVLAALALAVALVPRPLAADEAKLDFSLPDVSGKTVTLKALLARGPVLVDFWATYCKPCKKELPYLEALYKEYGAKGFTVVAISIDDARNVSKVKPFVESSRYTFPVLLDTNGDVKRRFEVSYMPTLFILDKNGKKFYSHIGYVPGDEKAAHDKVAELMGAGGVAPEEKSPAGDATGETHG